MPLPCSIVKVIEQAIEADYDLLIALLEKHRPHHHHSPRPWLVVNGVAIELIPNQEIHVDITLSVGHTLTDSILFLDAVGNPMLTTVTPDSPPTWTQSTPATETLTASADGLTFSGPAIAVGTDSVGLTVVVGGVTFSASQSVTVTAAPQVLTSVAISPAVS